MMVNSEYMEADCTVRANSSCKAGAVPGKAVDRFCVLFSLLEELAESGESCSYSHLTEIVVVVCNALRG